jgi:dTDP-4-amino-4,6-dideoxygalactose transaminase
MRSQELEVALRPRLTLNAAVGSYLIPDLPTADEILPYLRRIDSARWYSNFGPLVSEFEGRLQALISARDDPNPQAGRVCLTALATGHQALEIGLRLLGIEGGKRVLLPAVTFSACPLAVLQTGAQPVLADVDPRSWTLTPRIAREAASRTEIDAIMPVAAYGVPLLTPEWDDFSRDTGIPVLIDAAAAIETQGLPRRGLVAHSLHATKPFGIGEGGILAGREAEMIAKGRQYANFGMIDRITRTMGTNAKMSEYHAATGLAQMDRWTDVKRRRRQLLALYIDHAKILFGSVTLQPSIEEAIPSSLMLRLHEPIADAVLAAGKRAGIGLHRTYLPPLYRHPCFANLVVVNSAGSVLLPGADIVQKELHMTNSETLFGHLLGVPFHPFMSEADVINVVEWLRTQVAA